MTCRAAINGKGVLIVRQHDFPRFEPGGVVWVGPAEPREYGHTAQQLAAICLCCFGVGVCAALMFVSLGGGF